VELTRLKLDQNFQHLRQGRVAEINYQSTSGRTDFKLIPSVTESRIADCAVILFLIVLADRGSKVADSYSLFEIILTYVNDSLLVVQYLSGHCCLQNTIFFFFFKKKTDRLNNPSGNLGA
jgi:hypothetical protein